MPRRRYHSDRSRSRSRATPAPHPAVTPEQPPQPEPHSADRAAEEVRLTLAHLGEVERLAHIGSWEWDIVHDVVTWSAELYHMFGVDPRRFSATREGVLGLIHRDDRARMQATVDRACRERTSYAVEHRIVRPSDGAVRVCLSRGEVVCDEAGRPIRVFGTWQDITERRQVEEALARYVSLVVSSEDAIITKTLDGTILTWNPGAELLYGYTAAEAEGRPISMLFPPGQRAEWEGILDRMRRGERVEHYETVRIRRDGSRVDVSVSVSPMRDLAGKIIGASSIARDISDRRRVADELARSRTQLRAFAGRLRAARETERTLIAREIHDELGQALTALKMDLFSLKGSVPTPLLPKADGMVRLIDQMVDKVRTLAAELRPAVLDTQGLVAAVEWAAREFAHRTGIACRLDLPTEPVQLDIARSTDVFRILQEALTNIVRHSGATRVDVHLRATPGEIVLEVHDNGRGITPSELSAEGSLGILGMRERALSWGGEVGVRTAPQGGTSVTVCMPLGHGRPGAAA